MKDLEGIFLVKLIFFLFNISARKLKSNTAYFTISRIKAINVRVAQALSCEVFGYELDTLNFLATLALSVAPCFVCLSAAHENYFFLSL